MYLRHTTRKKDGKIHRYWTLVRSVRVGRRVIQQTVARLGELDEHGRLEARALARHVIGEPEQARLFDDGSGQLTVPVRLKGIRIERSRQFGDVYLALALWRGTGLAQLCEELLPAGKEQVPWEKIAAVLVTARLCEPSSELHIAEDWYRRTALSDLLQLDETQVNKDRLYRALDELLLHKAAIEAHLSRRCGELFAIDNEVLLYDVTSTYFEGQAQANPLAQRGYSRDHRPDCKQVCIGLVVSFDGFPLGYEVFPGNMHDSRTVQQIVTTMEARHGALGRVWIADRGMSSAANLAWLRETNRRYIVGAPKSELKKFAAELCGAGWREIREGIEVKLARCPETGDTIILCRSADRRTKEQAMHEKFSARIVAALERLSARIYHSTRRIDPTQVNRQIGRILQKNQRADRVQAHILVCFLAFVLWKTLELWQQRAGLGNSPRTVLEEIARIQSNDVILPTTTHGNIRLRCITQPDPAQAMLLERLGIVLPKRTRLTELDPPAVAPIAARA